MYKHAVEIVKKLQEKGHSAVFAGGFVRDMLIGLATKTDIDIDIATSATPEEVLAIFPEANQTGKSFGVMRVKHGEFEFEIASFREDVGIMDGRHPAEVKYTRSMEVDAWRRDFTINAMYFDPISNEIHDFVGGRDDIKNRVIRFVGNAHTRIYEDYLRMLRAIRFAAKFHFELIGSSKVQIFFAAFNIEKLPQERIFGEINKIFETCDVGLAFRLLNETQLLAYIFPEVYDLYQFEQPREFHPEGDVLTHTLQVLDHIPMHSSLALCYAALLHDTGKAFTKGFHRGRITFYGHDKKSEEIAEAVLQRVKADNKLIEDVKYLVGTHMKFGNVKKFNSATFKRFVSHPLFFDSMRLHYADVMGGCKKLDNYDYILQRMATMNLEEIKKEVKRDLINGQDLKDLGYAPGPSFKTILMDVKDRYLNGLLTSREDALRYVCDTY